MRNDPLSFLGTELESLKQQGLYRKLRILEGRPEAHTTFDHKSVVNLSSNNYLGLTTHPKLIAAATEAVEKYGVGSGAVRTISGTMEMHMELERRLAKFKHVESVVVFQSGFAANAGTVAAILTKDDVVVSDPQDGGSAVRRILWNDGGTRLVELAASRYPATGNDYDVAFADLDRDGDLDLLFGSRYFAFGPVLVNKGGADANMQFAATPGTGFWLARTEVTVAAYAKYAARRGLPARSGDPRLPVTGLSWPEAKAYCIAVGGRLPTEAEWEYAARAGASGAYYGPLPAIAWYEANSEGAPQPGGRKRPNAFGLYDMLGNVWEWVEADPRQCTANAADNQTCTPGMVMGGSYATRSDALPMVAEGTRAVPRTGNFNGWSSPTIGFRVACKVAARS